MWSKRALGRWAGGLILPDRIGWFRDRLSGAFDRERDRWALWLPVALGIGIGVYFRLPEEPPIWIGPAATIFLGFGTYLLRWRARTVLLACGLTAIAVGFATAQIRTASIAAPMLAEDIGPVQIIGTVAAVEILPGGLRVILENVQIEDVPPDRTPGRARIRITMRDVVLAPGDRIDLLVKLGPPSPPVMPGGFDFQRDAFFRGIGAQGFAYGGPRPVAEGEVSATSGARQAFGIWTESIRQKVVARIVSVLPSAKGGVAAALMTGTQTAIPRASVDAMRNVGLAHLLAVSGLHIGLVTGTLFVAIRALLALLPALALRFPIKKWAALAAFFGAFAYLFLTGGSVPTQRAFLMTGLVLFAVIIDRTAISMRLVAWAATVVLLLKPESMTGPSFQLSFAAVVALIAVYETSRSWWARRRERGPAWLRPLTYLGAVAVTTLVAEAATAPFALYHFNHVAAYGLVANLVAVPITALWIMPWAVVAYLLMPLGLDALALVPMGWGIDVVLWIADMVSGWPGSANYLPAMSLAGLVLVTLGGLWLAVWRGRWRHAGWLPVVLGAASLALHDPPQIIVSSDARLVAVAAPGGDYAFSSTRINRFEAEIWMRRAGREVRLDWPDEGFGAGGRLICDTIGCLYRVDGQVVAIAWRAAALADDCAIAGLVLSLEPARNLCSGPAYVIDRLDIWRNGAYAIWIDRDGFRTQSVAETRGERPWVADSARRTKPGD